MNPQLHLMFPLHVACVGEWHGTYTEFDASNQTLDSYDSRLVCSIPTHDTVDDYHQVNRYIRANGKVEEYSFPARVIDARLCWDNDRMRGYAEEVGDGRSVLVQWIRKDLPGTEFFEMVQFNREITRRARVWARYLNGQLAGRTLISEVRVK